ncbi:MAG: deoxyribodipyrimidine photo-lyase [Reichenbachiella sp.]|uniref:deoxyribodipyrimidine photo-lyase n=1 Tax=Reichenbachiella sp. TaxID=2184521 RepID=UPI00326504E9
MKRALVIFTNDLRLNDQSVIDHLRANQIDYVPVYLDYFEMIPSQEFFPINVTKRKFILNAIEHLKKALYLADRELIVIDNNYMEALTGLIERYGVNQIFLSRNSNILLKECLDSLELKLLKNNIFIHYFDSNYLIDLEDLSFPMARMPSDFRTFRTKIKGVKLNAVNDQVVVPDPVLSILEEIQQEEIPVLLPYKTRLNNHFSKFLPYLSCGMISPAELLEVIKQRMGVSLPFDKKALKVLTNQLIKLDFVRASMRNQSQTPFFEESLTSDEIQRVDQWIEGKTDSDLINAIMHKLRDTSMISLTSKRLAILYYLKVLNLPKFFGYHYFENQLLEYDSSLNLFLWLEYDKMEYTHHDFRHHIIDQQQYLDPKHSFVAFWN